MIILQFWLASEQIDRYHRLTVFQTLLLVVGLAEELALFRYSYREHLFLPSLPELEISEEEVQIEKKLVV